MAVTAGTARTTGARSFASTATRRGSRKRTGAPTRLHLVGKSWASPSRPLICGWVLLEPASSHLPVVRGALLVRRASSAYRRFCAWADRWRQRHSARLRRRARTAWNGQSVLSGRSPRDAGPDDLALTL